MPRHAADYWWRLYCHATLYCHAITNTPLLRRHYAIALLRHYAIIEYIYWPHYITPLVFTPLRRHHFTPDTPLRLTLLMTWLLPTPLYAITPLDILRWYAFIIYDVDAIIHCLYCRVVPCHITPPLLLLPLRYAITLTLFTLYMIYYLLPHNIYYFDSYFHITLLIYWYYMTLRHWWHWYYISLHCHMPLLLIRLPLSLLFLRAAIASRNFSPPPILIFYAIDDDITPLRDMLSYHLHCHAWVIDISIRHCIVLRFRAAYGIVAIAFTLRRFYARLAAHHAAAYTFAFSQAIWTLWLIYAADRLIFSLRLFRLSLLSRFRFRVIIYAPRHAFIAAFSLPVLSFRQPDAATITPLRWITFHHLLAISHLFACHYDSHIILMPLRLHWLHYADTLMLPLVLLSLILTLLTPWDTLISCWYDTLLIGFHFTLLRWCIISLHCHITIYADIIAITTLLYAPLIPLRPSGI